MAHTLKMLRRPLQLPSYMSDASCPRFVATQRRRRWIAGRHGMLIVVWAAALNCLWPASVNADALRQMIATNAIVALLAVAGFVFISTRPRVPPDIPLLGVLAAVDIASVTLALSHPEFQALSSGYLLLLPVIVALVIPWTTRVHFFWLLMHAAITITYAVLAAAQFGVDEGPQLAVLLISTALSQYGHIAGLRARVDSFVQISRINALNRQSRRDHHRLDRLNRLLDQTARTDELTQLKNRLSLKLDLVGVRARIQRHDEHVVLLLADLDHFKEVNDHIGHVGGDGVLRTVADCLAASSRRDDGVYRFGGEEFALVIRVVSKTTAIKVAERIRENVAALNIPHPANPPHGRVTVSIGAVMIGRAELELDDAVWFERADAALYEAKREGRNQSAVWTGTSNTALVVPTLAFELQHADKNVRALARTVSGQRTGLS